jgi:hypothetical protein
MKLPTASSPTPDTQQIDFHPEEPAQTGIPIEQSAAEQQNARPTETTEEAYLTEDEEHMHESQNSDKKESLDTTYTKEDADSLMSEDNSLRIAGASFLTEDSSPKPAKDAMPMEEVAIEQGDQLEPMETSDTHVEAEAQPTEETMGIEMVVTGPAVAETTEGLIQSSASSDVAVGTMSEDNISSGLYISPSPFVDKKSPKRMSVYFSVVNFVKLFCSAFNRFAKQHEKVGTMKQQNSTD